MEDEVGDSQLAPEANQRLEVAEAGMHAAVGHKPDQVDPVGAAERGPQHRVLGQPAAAGGVIDAGQILHHDRAGPEAEVSDLRIAHLVVREPHRAA